MYMYIYILCIYTFIYIYIDLRCTGHQVMVIETGKIISRKVQTSAVRSRST